MQTCTKVDDKIEQKKGVWDAVEGNPVSTKVVVEEGDDHRKNNQVGNQQIQHKQIPVESGKQFKVYIILLRCGITNSISRATLLAFIGVITAIT